MFEKVSNVSEVKAPYAISSEEFPAVSKQIRRQPDRCPTFCHSVCSTNVRGNCEVTITLNNVKP